MSQAAPRCVVVRVTATSAIPESVPAQAASEWEVGWTDAAGVIGNVSDSVPMELGLLVDADER